MKPAPAKLLFLPVAALLLVSPVVAGCSRRTSKDAAKGAPSAPGAPARTEPQTGPTAAPGTHAPAPTTPVSKGDISPDAMAQLASSWTPTSLLMSAPGANGEQSTVPLSLPADATDAQIKALSTSLCVNTTSLWQNLTWQYSTKVSCYVAQQWSGTVGVAVGPLGNMSVFGPYLDPKIAQHEGQAAQDACVSVAKAQGIDPSGCHLAYAEWDYYH